jgi:hypothetical protein
VDHLPKIQDDRARRREVLREGVRFNDVIPGASEATKLISMTLERVNPESIFLALLWCMDSWVRANLTAS